MKKRSGCLNFIWLLVITPTTAQNVWNGIQSQGINYIYNSGTSHNDNGLKFLCNTFRPTGTTTTGKIGQLDMGIMYNTTTMIYSGINFHQQDVDALSAPIGAGNMFSYGGTSVKYDYFSHGVGNISKIRYDFDGGTGRIPLVYTGSAVTTFSQSVNSCNLNPLPAFGVTNTTSYYKNRLSTLLPKMDSVKQILSSSDVVLSYFNDSVSASVLKDSLLDYSPYLSDSVLISTIKDTDLLSKNDIADVVIANSPVTQRIKDTLNIIAMSCSLRALIDSAQTGTSARENSEGLFSNLGFEKNMIQNDILRSELNRVDTLAMPDDSIITDIYEFVESGNTLNKDDLLAYYYSEHGDYAHTDSIINYLNGTYEQENIAKLVEVYKDLKQNGKNIYSIATDSSLQQLIMQVVGDSTRRGYDKAIALLQEVFRVRHHEIIEDIQGDESKSMILKPAKENSTSSNGFINCYPNPASQLINFSYQLPNGTSQGIIAIYNCFGQNIKNIPISNIQGIESVNMDIESNGLYFYTLIVNATTIGRNKFVINK